MNIAHPEALYATLVILPILAIILFRNYIIRKGDLERILGLWRSQNFLTLYWQKSLLSGLSLILGFLFALIAVAGLSWGNTPVEDPRSGLDVALVLDVSRSMEAQDIKPSRLKKSVELFKALIVNLPEARFSLTVYKGTAQMICPLTQDTHTLEQLLDSVSYQMISSPGSSLEAGLVTGFSTFNIPSPRFKFLLLATDGELRGGLPLGLVQQQALQDRRLLTLGAGTVGGSTIPTSLGPLKDGDWEVTTRLDKNALVTLAKAGKGDFFDLAEPGVFNRILNHFTAVSGNSGGVMLEPVNQYRLFLGLALMFFLLSLGVKIKKWRKIF